MGFRNLLECQEVASGPVSASPSPTTTLTIRSGIVERGAEGVRDAVAQFAAFVNGARNLGRAMAPQLSWKRKSAEEFEQARFVVALRRVDLRIGPFQIAIRDHGRSAVSRTRDVDHVQVVFADDAIEMDPHKGLAWIGAPMSEQPMFEVFGAKRLSQQGIVMQVDHSRAHVVAGSPVGVRFPKFVGGQCGGSRLLRHLEFRMAHRYVRSVTSAANVCKESNKRRPILVKRNRCRVSG